MIFTNIELAISNQHAEAKIGELLERSKKVGLNWDEQKMLTFSMNAFQHCYIEMVIDMAECLIKDLERKQDERAKYKQTQLARKRFHQMIKKEKSWKNSVKKRKLIKVLHCYSKLFLNNKTPQIPNLRCFQKATEGT